MKTIATALCLLSPAACATTTRTDLVDVVKRKASFDLQCEELDVVELSNGQSMTNGFAASAQKSYGVEGCGKRASYSAWCTNMLGSESCDAIPSNAIPSSAAAAPSQG